MILGAIFDFTDEELGFRGKSGDSRSLWGQNLGLTLFNSLLSIIHDWAILLLI